MRKTKLFVPIAILVCGVSLGVGGFQHANQWGVLNVNGLNDEPIVQIDEQRLLSREEILQRFETFAPGFLEADGAAALDRALDQWLNSAEPSVVGGGFGDRMPAIFCEVRVPDASASTHTVSVANYQDQSYWLYYNSGGSVAPSVLFIVVPLSAGSPLKVQIQGFDPGGSSTNMVTPFGIPFWGGDATLGPWALAVKAGNQAAVWAFDVVP